ncbi:MAG: patatin-like phospholipase family protein [Bacteroidetes bacterium]|nr:patatin-like phospholipase family protein [Bacteroidota bacterium]
MSKLGIALGGGGARGLAHIGVLKVLDEAEIKISAITGCSMGAVIGGLYAYFQEAKKVEDFILEAIKDPRFAKLDIETLNDNNKAITKTYLEKFSEYVKTRIHAINTLGKLSYFDSDITDDIYNAIPDVQIESLNISFSAIATDLNSGEEINFTKGSLRNIVKASSAIPGVFPPVSIDNYLLVDGSASESVPVRKVKELGADRVLAIDVIKSLKIYRPINNILDVLYRTEDVTSYQLSKIRLTEADLIISPQVKELSWADFDGSKKIIELGEIAAKENLDQIKKLIKKNAYSLKINRYIRKIF